ncbi:hypothetical protein F9C07_6867 [Aspergillus flavus]|uniref:Uncharacterized protein n=1 Tax=Aspergillus flavus (strain ATCC 200026 / FGSC A1120 / IAM 13836 / NRRL 3357 / JCM 12722 / SRRC 167) TaxID=332952 RepID=A0A7U2QUP6_ASPFN|nr:hypothetical protein F9C07_6867 [Aspergillus flavus]
MLYSPGNYCVNQTMIEEGAILGCSTYKMPNTEEYASLMSEPRKASLRDQKKHTASQISQLSQFSTASSSVSDSLEQKVKALSSQRELLVI